MLFVLADSWLGMTNHLTKVQFNITCILSLCGFLLLFTLYLCVSMHGIVKVAVGVHLSIYL